MHQHQDGRNGRGGRLHRRLLVALVITALYAGVEVTGGLLAGSLALVADAAHMATDALALGLSLFAAWLATRPTTARNTFGFLRAEVLAALANGGFLVAIVGVSSWQAAHRLAKPPVVADGPVILIATLGLLVNLGVAGLLMRAGHDNINARAAFLDALSDSLSSLGAVVAGLVIALTGFQRADPLASLFIAVLILVAAWRLLREVLQVLLEGVPPGIDLADVVQTMVGVAGVRAVHDVHVWTVTSGYVALSAHAELDDTEDPHQVLDALTDTLARRFHIAHVTIQSEDGVHAAECCAVGSQPADSQRHPALVSVHREHR